MDNFPAAITTRLVEMIKPLIKQEKYDKDKNMDKLCRDVLVHLHHCTNLMRNYSVSGFEKLLASVQNLLSLGRNNEHNPILIAGPSYCGKSTFVAKLCHQCRDILGPDTFVIVRYIRLTQSSNIPVNLLREICMQINHALRQNIDLSSYDFSHLKSYFHGLKNRISKASNNFVIILDDIDYLEGINVIRNVDDKNDFDWLMSKLPTKVHVIMSINNVEVKSTLIKALHKKCETTESVVDFPEWTELQYSIILNRRLDKIQRKLTDHQESIIMHMLTESSPVMLKTCFEMVEKPEVEFDAKYQHLPSSLNDALEVKMQLLEHSFSLEIVQAIMRYLTISDFGITEMELLDCLSANMDIISALDLDSQAISRFPIHLWISLRKDLGECFNHMHRSSIVSKS